MSALRYNPKPFGKGRRTLENEAARRVVWPRILRRARFCCEGCGRPNVVLSWGHIFGRPGSGLCLGAWANTEHLTMALCEQAPDGGPGCHLRIDRHADPMLRELLEWRAANRLAQAYQRDAAKLAADAGITDPADAVRALIRELEADGIQPDEGVVSIDQ